MKQINGLWVPDTENTNWLEKLPVVAGFPGYEIDRISAALSTLARIGRPLRHAVDGGANVGLWTVRLMEVPTLANLVAVEPIAELQHCLARNIVQQASTLRARGAPVPNVNIDGGALDEEAGKTVRLIGSPRKSVGWSVTNKVEGSDKTEIRTAPTVSIDGLELPGCDLIKLDIEGAEIWALRGAERTIKTHAPVVVMEDKHDPHHRAADWLRLRGYRVVWQKKHDYVWAMV